MKKFELSIGQAVNLVNKCKKMLNAVNLKTPKEMKDMTLKYAALVEKQLHRQCDYPSNIFNDLRTEIRVAMYATKSTKSRK